MKICQLSHVEHSYSFLAPLFSALAAEGHEVVAACNLEFGGEKLRQYLGDGYPFHQIRVGRRVTWQAMTTDVLRLARYLKQQHYDVVHVHYPLVSLQGRLAAAIAQVPIVVYHAHGFYFHEGTRPLPRAALIALERSFGRYLTDHLITVNAEDFEFARRRRFRPNLEDIVLSPGVGIDTELFRPLQMQPQGALRRKQLRSVLGVPEDDFVVTFVGRLVAEKGVLELAEAFTRLAEQRSAWLWLVGDVQASERDQSLLRRLDGLLRGHPAAERVLRLGRRQDIPQIHQASDLFVLPSYREGMPVALLEAMSCGLPVIATDVRGCREAVGRGVAGVLVAPRDVDALTRALLSLMGDYTERQRLGDTARSFVDSHFTVAHSLKPQLELYRRIEASLNQRRRGAVGAGQVSLKPYAPGPRA